MKKTAIVTVVLALGTAAAIPVLHGQSGDAAAGNGVVSLRGQAAIDETTRPPEPKRWQRDRGPLPREHVGQPPLIPHSIKGYKINLKFNKCLTCHSWANAGEAGAPKVSVTHFKDREGNVLGNVSPRRYFCTQCHVPQVDAPPLVENTFEPLPTIRKGR
ncbi:MAG TPA: nitrate reductase cytochrome c-type subunit [Chromatiales bacterium]|nr:nitrate reductase cytochrome c-type subunit [Chromatiales bacterium]